MAAHSETRDLPYTAEQMFAVVADVENYPKFLPWCAALRIRGREHVHDVEYLTAEMVVAYKGFNERYTSRVRLDKKANEIEAKHVQGPFERLDTLWRFEPLPEGSRVHFSIDFAFKSRFLSALASLAFDMVARLMADAFIERAHELYATSAR